MALVAALERQLGCLVGVNAYLTPPGTQGDTVLQHTLHVGQML
jgi:hypothetical protein